MRSVRIMISKLAVRNKGCFDKRDQKNSKRGFTLAEMLAAILILSLATAAMVSTIALASNQFNSSMRESESLVLASSLKNIISDELAYTTEIHIDADDNVVSFQSQNYAQEECLGAWTTDGSGSDGYGLIAIGNVDDIEEQMLILGAGSYTRGVNAKITEVKYDNAEHLFTVTLSIKYKDQEVTSETFQVRNVNMTTAVR